MFIVLGRINKESFMLVKIRDYLAAKPSLFSLFRKILELNFIKEKKIIRDFFDLRTNKQILDIGCGTGEFSGLFKNLDYCGIDISASYINYAAAKNKGNFQVMDATHLKFSNNSFDYVLIMAVLHHLTDTEVDQVLSEAKRVLKPNGKILIMEDAKIKEMDNLIINFFQKFDKGRYIRTPAGYRRIINPFFNIIKEFTFRSGVCTYYGAVIKKQ
jgi:ubiquinone/menaquinone biosynthesis C-methylase UbiE